MNSPLRVMSVVLAGLLPLAVCGEDSPRERLREALRMHASFDRDFAADFSRGDPTLYEFTNRAERQQGGRPARADAHLQIDPDQGRFGGSLVRAEARAGRLMYRGGDIIVPREGTISGSVSVWLRTTPEADLPDGYCDPVMILSDDFKKGALFIEWSPGEQRRFRYGIVPPNARWNPTGRAWDEIPVSERPMVQPEAAEFSRERWVHVVFTFDRINAGREASGKLYLDGRPAGTISGWDLTFEWNTDDIILALGWSYVGGIDDLAVFDRALSEEDIAFLNTIAGGVGALAPQPAFAPPASAPR